MKVTFAVEEASPGDLLRCADLVASIVAGIGEEALGDALPLHVDLLGAPVDGEAVGPQIGMALIEA